MPKYELKRLVKNLFRVDLYWFQELFLYDCLNHKRVIGLFPRQTGKSMTLAIFCCLEAQTIPDGHIVIIAPTDRQAGEIFLKISGFIMSSKFAEMVTSSSKREIVFVNGCRISAYPSGDDGGTIRGLTGDVIIQEEASYIKDSIEAEVITPMGAATDAKIIKIGTPFGKNHYYRSSLDDRWRLHRIGFQDAIDVGQFTLEFIEEQRNNLTEMQFLTEYDARFIEDSDSYFKSESIQRAIEEYPMIEMVYA